jgi:hypothetical protein
MKKLAIILSVVAAMTMIFSACTTYEEGPGFTILTPEARIKGTWNQTTFLVNDEDQNNSIISEFTINSDGTGTQRVMFGDLDGGTEDIEWQFNDDKTLLQFREPGDDSWDEMTIKRLTNKEMWLIQDTELLGTWEFRYEKE